MKKIAILFGLIILLGVGCKTATIGYKSESTGETVRDCSSLTPDNPYSNGSGHFAGFEWAERKQPTSCGGNSQSFIEGCEEYESQEANYQSCLNK